MVIGDGLKKYGRFTQGNKDGRGCEGFKRGFEGLGVSQSNLYGFVVFNLKASDLILSLVNCYFQYGAGSVI